MGLTSGVGGAALAYIALRMAELSKPVDLRMSDEDRVKILLAAFALGWTGPAVAREIARIDKREPSE